jgi:lipoprotein Spr
MSRPCPGTARTPVAARSASRWILLAGAALVGCASTAPRLTPLQPPPTVADSSYATAAPLGEPATDHRPLLAEIMSLMGVPYAFNGTDTSGFDCSGFTSAVFASSLHRTIPHSSQGQYALGTSVDRDSLRFGDLVFFAEGGGEVSHVGIYVGDGLFAHASVSLGVTISLLDSSYYKKRYLGARRLPR